MLKWQSSLSKEGKCTVGATVRNPAARLNIFACSSDKAQRETIGKALEMDDNVRNGWCLASPSARCTLSIRLFRGTAAIQPATSAQIW